MSRWFSGELWIPYDHEHRVSQERFMNSLLQTGQFFYKDATRIACPGEEPKYFWILIKPPQSAFMRNARARVLPVEQVERVRNYRATNGLDVSLGGGASIGGSDAKDSFRSQFDTHEPTRKLGAFSTVGENRAIHSACATCAKECKVYDAPNSSFTCFEKVSKKALRRNRNAV